MDICLISDNPETPGHPVLGAVLRQLSATHAVRLLDVDHLTGDEAIAHEAAHPIADLYLLKSHTPQALSVAHHLEQRGAVVINSWASALACQDRVRMVQRMRAARLPCPPTRSFASLEDALRPDGIRQDVRVRGLHQDCRVIDERDAQVGNAARRSLARTRVRKPAPLPPAAVRDPLEKVREAARVFAGVAEALPVEVVRQVRPREAFGRHGVPRGYRSGRLHAYMMAM